MPYRIRIRAGGDLEVEVDTPVEVQSLLEVAVPGGVLARPRRALRPVAMGVEPGPASPRRVARRTTGKGGRPARDVARRSPPRSRSSEAVTDEALIAIVTRGPVATGAIAKEVRVPRHKVTARLNALQARGLVHATGATISRRWHLGAGPAAPARRAL
jgi:hypothetical protein